MLKRLKVLLSRSTFLTGFARKGRAYALSVARRLGWVRLHELSAAKSETESLAARLSESIKAHRRDQEQIARLSLDMSRQADVQRRDQEHIARLSLDMSRQAKASQNLKDRFERQVTETASVQGALVQAKQKSTAFAQQLEIWRDRAAEYKRGAGLQVEKLAVSRSRIKDLEQQTERLSADRANADQQIRNLIAAMRAREMAAAQDLSMIRTALARVGQQEAPGGRAAQERLLFAEINRLSVLAEAQGQTLHLAFDASSLLGEIRSGRMAVVSFSLDDVVGNYPSQPSLLLTSERERGIDPRSITQCGVFKVSPVLPLSEDESGRFDLVVAAFDIEEMPDPVEAIAAAASRVAPGGRIVILGAAASATWSNASNLWRTPPKMLQSLLPDWTWDRFILAGPGSQIGIEVVDPALLLEFRPAPGQGASLLAPPYMSFVAVARNQSRGHRV